MSKIRDAFRMRLKGDKIVEIAKHVGLEKGRTGERLKDRRYVDAGVIDLAMWQRVQKVRIVRPVAERLKLQGHQTEAKIVEILTQGPATVRAISEKMGLTDPGVRCHLQALRRAGKVSKEPRKWGPYKLLN